MDRQTVLQMRAQARQRQAEVTERLRGLHELAVAELANAGSAEYVRAEALRQVGLWESGHLCHASYVETWRRLLYLPAAEVAAVVLQDTPEAVALRQNSPFGFLVGRVV